MTGSIHLKRALAFAAVIYLLAVSFSVYCLVLKRDAIQFHTRDYSYFIEQAAKLADPRLTNRFALNIEGRNFLGLQGTEAVNNPYQAIHTEYFRYTYALIYALFHSTLPVYTFYCLIFFLPLLYFAFLQGAKPGGWKVMILFSLLYVLLPVMVNSITYELRPRVLFASAWSLAVLAVMYERPFLEKLLAFGLLLSIREEGIVLGLAVIGLNFLHMGNRAGRWKQALILLALDATAFGLFLAFMRWGDYTRVDALFDPRNLLNHLLSAYLYPILAVVILLVATTVLIWRKRRAHMTSWWMLLVYVGVLAVTVVPFAQDFSHTYEVLNSERPLSGMETYLLAVTYPQGSLSFYVFILLMALLWDHTAGRSRQVLQAAMLLLCAGCLVTTLVAVPGQLEAWQQSLPSTRLVWNFKAGIDRYQTNVLVDYSTYQAFYDCENIVVYNRLPLWMVDPEERFYPDNKQVLAQLIRERMEYAVIARDSYENVRELANLAGVSPVELTSNDRYVVLKLR